MRKEGPREVGKCQVGRRLGFQTEWLKVCPEDAEEPGEATCREQVWVGWLAGPLGCQVRWGKTRPRMQGRGWGGGLGRGEAGGGAGTE